MEPVFILRLFGLEISDTIVVSLALTLIVLLLTSIASLRLRVHEPSLWQVVLEIFVTWVSDTNFFSSLMASGRWPSVSSITGSPAGGFSNAAQMYSRLARGSRPPMDTE